MAEAICGWWLVVLAAKQLNLIPNPKTRGRANIFALPLVNLRSWRTDSNPRPADYKSAALPTELRQRVFSNYSITVKDLSS